MRLIPSGTPFFLPLLLILPASPVRLHAQDATVHLLQHLADAPGPPGAEDAVRSIMVAEMRPVATAPLRYDGMGSVIAQVGSNGPRIMIDAHMDELGGMVRRVGSNGQLTMQMLGGWLDQALVDQRWVILGSKGPVRPSQVFATFTSPRRQNVHRSSQETRSFSTSAQKHPLKPPPWALSRAIRSCRIPPSRS